MKIKTYKPLNLKKSHFDKNGDCSFDSVFVSDLDKCEPFEMNETEQIIVEISRNGGLVIFGNVNLDMTLTIEGVRSLFIDDSTFSKIENVGKVNIVNNYLVNL